MPTGYTAAIAEGISFNDFVMRCSRNMGALITMRDEPMNAPIPDKFEPDPYYAQRVDELQKHLEALQALTPAEVNHKSMCEYTHQVAYRTKRLSEISELKDKYQIMLDKVQKWVPPTDDHKELKRFMIYQVAQSMESDCDVSYYSKEPEIVTGKQWLEKEITKTQKDLNYYSKEHSREVERVEKRNQWLKALRESLVKTI